MPKRIIDPKLIPRILKIRIPKHGEQSQPPGTLPKNKDNVKAKISVIAYNSSESVSQVIEDTSEINNFLNKWDVVWVNIDGIDDTDTIKKIGSIFGIHPLIREDIAIVPQRPKIEQLAKHIFIISRILTFDERIVPEQISILFDQKVLLSFQEHEGDCFNGIRTRIENKRGRITSCGTDYLTFSLIDSIIDSYFPVIEDLDLKIQILEDEILDNPEQVKPADIQNVKRDLLAIRRSIWPMREALSVLIADESPLIKSENIKYYRDVYEHVVQLIDLTETYREMASGLLEMHMASISNKMNNVMKTLTIVSTIFIPLSFIAGLYGMNFDRMPELHFKNGYYYALAVMLGISIFFLIVFWRMGWITFRKK